MTNEELAQELIDAWNEAIALNKAGKKTDVTAYIEKRLVELVQEYELDYENIDEVLHHFWLMTKPS